MLKQKNINMLEGPLFFSVIRYTFPIILTNAFQLLFNAADIVVVGRFCGSISVAAVGSTSSLIHLITNLFIGLSIGCGITAAQSLGAGDKEKTKCIVHTALPVALICGVIITFVGILGANFFLTLMSTPSDILPLSVTYLKIYFLGITSTMVYNFCSAILRAMGDTKSPLMFLTVSGFLNVVLNLIFVIVFHLDVAGVAIATAASQTLAAVLSVLALIKIDGPCKLKVKAIKIYKAELLEFLRIGIPAGIQSCTFSFSNVIIQSSINSLGTAVVAGNSAAMNIDNFLHTITSAFHQTALNFTGQNVGIKNYKRAVSIFKICNISSIISAIAAGGLIILFAKPLLSIYITDSPDAIAIGVIRLTILGLTYGIGGYMDTTSGALRGTGISFTPMLASILGICGIRILWIYTIFQIPAFHNVTTIYISYPVTWIVTGIAETILYFTIIKKRQRQKTKNAKHL